MVMAVATLEPQMAAKAPHAPTVAMASPPLRLPIIFRTAQYRSLLRPDLKAKLPMRMNRGTTQ